MEDIKGEFEIGNNKFIHTDKGTIVIPKEKTADEMFKELGYEKIFGRQYQKEIVYEKNKRASKNIEFLHNEIMAWIGFSSKNRKNNDEIYSFDYGRTTSNK